MRYQAGFISNSCFAKAVEGISLISASAVLHLFMSVVNLGDLPDDVLGVIVLAGELSAHERFAVVGALSRRFNALAYALPLPSLSLYGQPSPLAGLISKIIEIVQFEIVQRGLNAEEADECFITRGRAVLQGSPFLTRLNRSTVASLVLGEVPLCMLSLIYEFFPRTTCLDIKTLYMNPRGVLQGRTPGAERSAKSSSSAFVFAKFNRLERLKIKCFDVDFISLPQRSIRKLKLESTSGSMFMDKAMIDDVASLSALTSLTLFFPVPLDKLTSLLSLSFSFVSPDELTVLDAYKSGNLRKLKLTPIKPMYSKPVPNVFSHLTSLKALALNQCESYLTIDSLTDLNLEELYFAPNTSANLNLFRSQRGLKEVTLDCSSLTGSFRLIPSASFAVLASFKGLRRLSLDQAGFLLGDFVALYPILPSLEFLLIDYDCDTRLDAKDWNLIVHRLSSANMRGLIFRGVPLSLPVFESISMLTNLENLELCCGAESVPESSWLKCLLPLSSLRELALLRTNGCRYDRTRSYSDFKFEASKITTNSFVTAMNQLEHLESLVVQSFVHKATGKQVRHLLTLPRLLKLYLAS